MVAQNSLNINGNGVVSYNNTTGVFSESAFAQYSALIGGAANSITGAAPSTAGFVLTSTGATSPPTFQAVPAVGGIVWVDVTSPTQLIAADTGYVTDNATLVTYTLPASPAFGSRVIITGGVSGSATTPWKIDQNASQQINFGNLSTTVGIGGSLTSTLKYDTVEMVCVVAGASAVWTVLGSVGNIIVT